MSRRGLVEQERIARELIDAQVALDAVSGESKELEQTLRTALRLSQNCLQTYLGAPGASRRVLNRTFFDRIDVFPAEGLRVLRASPFQEIHALVGEDEESSASEGAWNLTDAW